jgi:hypothetical protein
MEKYSGTKTHVCEEIKFLLGTKDLCHNENAENKASQI